MGICETPRLHFALASPTSIHQYRPRLEASRLLVAYGLNRVGKRIGSNRGPGRRGRCRASPPTEPDVRALPHPVPRVSGSLRDVFAPDPQTPRTTVAQASVWLSAAVALTRVMELRVSSRVSRQRVRSRGAPLPSAGSRWPRFPVFVSTMKALRLPTLHPSGLLFSPVSTMCARSICVVARALPMPRRQVVGPGFGV